MDKKDLAQKLSNFTILFVDDDEELLLSLKRPYSRYFKEVFLASNGIEGLESYKQNRPHIVVTDVSMPKSNGLDMAQKIKEFDENLKIIFVTGHNEREFQVRFEEFGARAITKPMSLDLLFSHVVELLQV